MSLYLFLVAGLSAFLVSIGTFAYLFPKLMQRLPQARLNALELQMTELQTSHDALQATWKRFRSAEGMREMREARRAVRTQPMKSEINALEGSAWKEAKRKELGVALHNPKLMAQHHEQPAS